MVTNIMEGMTKKCEQYWPEGGSGQSYGPFNLSLVEQLTFADYVVRTFRLEVGDIKSYCLDIYVMKFSFNICTTIVALYIANSLDKNSDFMHVGNV